MIFANAGWKPDELNAVAALAGVAIASVAVVVATVTAYFQRRALRDAWLANSANVIKSFSERWVGSEMREHRRRFAKRLLDGDSFDIGLSCPVLEFFEDLAYITRRGVVDPAMVWNSFPFSIPRYYLFLTRPKDRIKESRKKHATPTLYQEFEWLYHTVSRIHAEEARAGRYVPPTDELIVEYLKDEAELP